MFKSACNFPSWRLIGPGVYYTNTNGFKAFAVQPGVYNLQTSLKPQPNPSSLHPGGLIEHSQKFNLFSLLTTKWNSDSKWAQVWKKGGTANPKSSSIPKFHSIHLPETKAGSPQAHKNVRALKTLSHPQLIPPDLKPMWLCGLDSKRYGGPVI